MNAAAGLTPTSTIDQTKDQEMNVNQYIKKIPTEQINRLMSLSGDVMISKEKQAKLKALYLAKFGKELTDDKLNELLARGALMLVQESMRRD